MSRTQAGAIALLGAWIGWTLFMWFAAGRSFSTLDGLLKDSRPEFAETSRPLGPDNTRVLLRYSASEINRAFFRAYAWAQVLLGALLLFLVLGFSPRDTLGLFLIGVMVALVLVLSFIITPRMVALGRSLDFVPRQPPPPGLRRFWMLHGAFTALDGTKLLVGLVVLVRWVVRR